MCGSAVPTKRRADSRDALTLRGANTDSDPVTFTLKPFLAKKGHSAEEVDKMHAAWMKSCLLQVTLWSYPYIKDGDY